MDCVGGGEELEVFEDDHVFVGAHEVRDVADEWSDLAVLVADGFAVDHCLASGWFEECGEDFDGGGFACAVWADESEAVALFDGEVEVFECAEFAVVFTEVDGFDHWHDGWFLVAWVAL